MAEMIVQYRVMPEDGEINYLDLENTTKKIVGGYSETVKIKEVGSVEIGFGIKAVRIKFQLDENCGSENLENELISNDKIGNVNVELMDRL